MHTNTFQSRFKVGDKITNGQETISIKAVGLNLNLGVYYRADNGYLYYELDLTNYHLAPRFAVGEKVWFQKDHKIVQGIIEQHKENEYKLQGLYIPRTEDQLFADAEACRAAIKVIPLSQ